MARERERVTTVVGDTEARGLLRFDVQREVLDFRNRTFVGRRRAPVVGGSGLEIQISRVLSTEEVTAIAADRAASAAFNRAIDAGAERLLSRVRKVTRPTYETGLFYSAWRVKNRKTRGLKGTIELENPAPYALYVHRKGAPRTRTVVNTYVKPLVKTAAAELVDDLVAVLKRRAVQAALSKMGGR